MIIFNEIIEVMNSVVVLFRQKKDEHKRRNALHQGRRKTIILPNMEVELDEEETDSFIMEKVLIVEAWSKYRPSSREGTPREGDEKRGRGRKRDIN